MPLGDINCAGGFQILNFKEHEGNLNLNKAIENVSDRSSSFNLL